MSKQMVFNAAVLHTYREQEDEMPQSQLTEYEKQFIQNSDDILDDREDTLGHTWVENVPAEEDKPVRNKKGKNPFGQPFHHKDVIRSSERTEDMLTVPQTNWGD